MESQNSQSNPLQIGDMTHPYFKLYYKSVEIKIVWP